ncbi:hypothetical protein LTR08_004787 [Meristemomyces frigidus]|nr:hypothetical protein LTR08_004787 [Meristemomyces frigidus]
MSVSSATPREACYLCWPVVEDTAGPSLKRHQKTEHYYCLGNDPHDPRSRDACGWHGHADKWASHVIAKGCKGLIAVNLPASTLGDLLKSYDLPSTRSWLRHLDSLSALPSFAAAGSLRLVAISPTRFGGRRLSHSPI